MMALGIIGFLAFLVCLGMVIANKVRKKPVKYWLIGAPIALIFFIVAVSTSPTTPTPSQPSQSPTTPTPSQPSQSPSKPTLTYAEQAYAKTVSAQLAPLAKAFTKLGELFQNFQTGNDEWTLQIATQILIIRNTYDEAMKLDPPSSMAEIHLKYIQAMKHYNDATYLITKGVDESNASLLTQASQELLTGRQLTNEATQLIGEFTEAHK